MKLPERNDFGPGSVTAGWEVRQKIPYFSKFMARTFEVVNLPPPYFFDAIKLIHETFKVQGHFQKWMTLRKVRENKNSYFELHK